jgi:hypothetical protein
VNEAQDLALFYFVPIALWAALILILFRVWWSRKLEDSLAYLVYLRERKVLFVSLIVGLACLHVVNESVKVANGFGWVSGYATLGVGLVASIAGAAILFLFAWFLVWRGPARLPDPVVLDLPENLAYSLGVLDRAEKARDRP